MQFDITTYLTNPFIPLFLAVFTGLIFGKIKFGKFSFGTSGTLFTGIVVGWALYSKYAVPFLAKDGKTALKNAPAYASNIIKNGIVSNDFFNLALVLFIAAVGLLAAKDLKTVLKKYGAKFILLTLVITGVGAITLIAAVHIFAAFGQDKYAIAGTYSGALTSSPSLASALEAAKQYGKEAQAAVGLGHTIAYAPGVLMTILVMNFFPLIFRMNMEKEVEKYNQEMGTSADKEEDKKITVKEVGFDLIAYFIVCFLGYTLGLLKIYLPLIKWFSLGATGGVLIVALVLGYIGKIGSLNFRMNTKILSAIRDLALVLFLAVVGIQYGYAVVHALAGSGAILVLVAVLVNLISLTIGFLFGRYVLKMNWIILSGALCGGATSTPGLGAAIDNTKSDGPAAGYGATYPFSLIIKVILVIVIQAVAYYGLA